MSRGSRVGRACAVALAFAWPRAGAAGAAESPPIRVAVDAGHGGTDDGCVSPRGLKEKEVVLDVARRLVSVLAEAEGIEAVLTRETDLFVPLAERTARANAGGAEIFVSLHANFARPDTISGFEVYYNSDKDLDEEAAAVAALEEAQREVSSDAATHPLARFLWNLTQEKYLEQSLKLSEALHASLSRLLGRAEEGPRLPGRGVRSQLFHVLNGAAMPAALVELGFLSCPYDAELLADAAFRERCARALGAGLRAFAPHYRAETARSN